ncbi:MAG: PKD domain-containing protein, partial [Bacteroidota bacterium]
YLWDFGDGNIATESMPTHQYQQEGIYYPCVTITDQFGCTDSYCYTAGVHITNPFADFTIDNNYGTCPPMFVNFQNQSSNVFSYKWDFGDASGFSTLESPTHIYAQPGNYDVTLIAYSPSANCVDTFVVENAIELYGPTGDFHFEIDTSCVPLEVTFFTENIDAAQMTWDYGDGSPLDSNVMLGNNGEHHYAYNSVGNYVPRLAISDGTGCVRVIEKADTIRSTNLNIDILASHNIICTESESVDFSAVTAPLEFIETYQWNFSGGSADTSTLPNPTITYSGVGGYDVALIASNTFCTDTIVREDFINIGKTPLVNFESSVTSGCAPLDVDFNNISSIEVGVIESVHWDFGDSTFSNLLHPNHTFEAGTHQVMLVVTSAVGCTDSISQEIIVYPSPEVELIGNDILCYSDSTELFANISGNLTGTTFYWENDPSLSCIDCLNPIASPSVNTVYTFVTINAEGCETKSQIAIDVGVYETPTLTLNPDTTICINDSIQLWVTSDATLTSFEWDNNIGLSCYNCPNPIANPLSNATYTVTITSSDGCVNSDSVKISVLDQQADLVMDRTICQGDSVQLNVTMGNQPQFENSATLSCNNCFTPLAFPSVSTAYPLAITTDEGCTMLDTANVNVMLQSDLEVGENQIICDEIPIFLQGEILNGTPREQFTFSWTPAGNLAFADSIHAVASPLDTTNYTLSATADLCTLKDSLTIYVISDFKVEAIGDEVCTGDTAQLHAVGYADSYRWYPPSGLSDPNSPHPTVVGVEDLVYTLTTELAHCPPAVSEAFLYVNEIPSATLKPVHLQTLGQPTPMIIENVEPYYAYSWSPSDGLSCADCPNPRVQVTNNTKYTVIITDLSTGCEQVLFTEVKLANTCPETLISVPNALTPNGDGVNDDLQIFVNADLELLDYKFQVYNRWGNVVFSTDDVNELWDGSYNGIALSQGVYIFMLEFICPVSNQKVYRAGDITIHF